LAGAGGERGNDGATGVKLGGRTVGFRSLLVNPRTRNTESQTTIHMPPPFRAGLTGFSFGGFGRGEAYSSGRIGFGATGATTGVFRVTPHRLQNRAACGMNLPQREQRSRSSDLGGDGTMRSHYHTAANSIETCIREQKQFSGTSAER